MSFVCVCYSSFPWFEIFYRLLNHFAELLNRGKTVEVKSLLVELYEARVPRQGMFVELHADSDDTVSATSQIHQMFVIRNCLVFVLCVCGGASFYTVFQKK